MGAVLVQRLKALSDETRLRMVQLLLRHDLCVGALACRLGISKAAVSQHMKTLREAGLVLGEKRGYWTHYRVQREVLKEIAGELMNLSSCPPDIEEYCNQSSSDGPTCREQASGGKRK